LKMLTTAKTFDYNIKAFNSHKYRYIINQGGSGSSTPRGLKLRYLLRTSQMDFHPYFSSRCAQN
ncbi:MAG: hypothetical protein IIT45_11220, partial [Treponema sp.]|nr:hypothetical protein [Treponema sp.]